MVVKGTNNGNKRKIDELTGSSSSSSQLPTGNNGNASTNPTTTTTSLPQSSPKNNIISVQPTTGSPPIPTKHNTIPRPRAQRKFAQGVAIPSPPVTPYKIVKPVTPVKRVPLPQYSPPTKRPKTEDFLTFLCYRGTSALPKSLNFFNYPSHYDRVTDYVKVKSRNELKSWRKSAHTPPTAAATSQPSSLPPQSSSSTQRSQGVSSELRVKETPPKSTQQKQSTNSRRKNTEAINRKADKEKLGKGNKRPNHQPTNSNPNASSGSTVPKPKPTHINEQDAKFAISALKLKYQEKRLASAKPTLSVATKIAKKVKDRRVILTRSKAKDDEVTEVTLKKNAKRPKTAVETTQELSRRNAPSPDIIDGVKQQGGRKGSSTSEESESTSSSEEGSVKSSKTSKSSSKGGTTTTEKGIRSLRSGGKSVIIFTTKSSVTQKVTIPKRISTRASRRTTSPLRELPMYGVMKKRKKKLKKEKPSGRSKKSDKKESDEKTSPDRGNSRRPSRKTKESAAFFLNLITKSFSSDENENGDKSDDDSEGDTSSSETKFLETRYKAIMKRDGEKGKKSTNENKKSSGKDTTKKRPTAVKKKPPDLKPTKKSRPEKRILRSQSSREEKRNAVSSARVTRHRRVTVPIPDKPVHAGAARKSASVYPRKTKRSSSSSSPSNSDRNSSSSTSSSSSDSEDSSERKRPEKSPEPKKNKRAVPPERPTRKKQVRKPTRSTDEEEGSDSESEAEKRSTGRGTRRRSFSTGVTSENLEPPEGNGGRRHKSDNSSSSVTTSGDSDSDTSTSEDEEEEKRVVEKVDIALQVDMDLEESLELEAAGQHGYPDDPPPPVLTPQINFMSQGCQSDLPPRSSPMTSHVPRSHHHPHPHHHPQPPMNHQHQSPPQITIPPPPLLPFPGPSFYPSLSNIEFISQQRTQQDFSVMLPTLGLPTVSTYSFGPSTVLTHNQLPSIPIGYTSASISAATTLQTHITQHNIRSVAANLDIPLVRPIVTPNLHSMPLTRPQADLHRPLTRPVMNVWPDTSRQNPIPPHYSAFRVPMSTTVISGPPQRMMPPVSSHLQQPQAVHPHQYPNVAEAQQQQQQQQARYQSHAATVNAGREGQVTYHPGISAHGLSLIQSLPNVSIVPKFDRTAKTVLIHPDQQPTTSSAVPPKPKKGKTKEKEGPPKERGRKRKELPFTKAPSPLLVRKDSINPITYVGKASRKNLKGKEAPEVARESLPEITLPTAQFNQLISEQNSSKCVIADCHNADKNSREKVTSKSDGVEPSNKRPNSKSTGSELDKGKATGPPPPDSHSQPKPEVPLEKSSKGKSDSDKSKSRTKSESGEKNSKGKRKDSIASSEGDKERSRPKKGGTESPRPASVSSDRPKSAESPDEVKVEDIRPYYPTEEEFQDPLKYIRQIQKEAEKFGIARIVPPKSFRPECNVEDDMRFTAYNHYIHRMNQRWGPNVHVRVGIMENLRKSKVRVTSSNPPMIGGMEVDLTTLYHTVQSLGGLTEVIQKDKWSKVSDAMQIPKAANDRVGKLDAIYVKYVLPYEMLSEHERRKLLNEVEKKWKVHVSRDPESESESDEDDPLLEAEDCITKGKSTPLSSYYRVARNTMNMLFKNKEPSPTEVESAYWKLVRERDRHLCVYSGSIDCAGLGWGFPLPKGGTKHPWNLKVLATNPGSILKSMGSVMGATVPTLHVGMVFTTYCWYRDPHNLPWIEYLHSGGNKIWYVIPASHEVNFRQVLKELMPRQCKDKKIWLTSDSAMVPPELLLSHGIPLYRTVQNPGEFLVVFPKTFTSAICTGYVISESVCYASPDWLQGALQTFQDIRESREPPVFPLEKLLLSILTDSKVSLEIFKMALPVAERVFNEELKLRKQLRDLGIGSGKMNTGDEKGKSKKKEENEVPECDTCNYVLHLSMVMHKSKKTIYCLPHGIKNLAKNKSRIKASTLLYDQTDDQLRSILNAVQARLK